MPYMNFSVTDLQKVLGFEITPESVNKDDLDKLLWNLGMNVKEGYEWRHCIHRALSTNIPQEGYRIEGYERLDIEHIKSGNASLEAIIASSKDPSLRNELLGMNPRGGTLEDITKDENDEGLEVLDSDNLVFEDEGDCV